MKEHDEHEMPKPCMTWRHAIAAVPVWLRISPKPATCMYTINLKYCKITKPVTLFENTKPNTRKLEAGLEYSEFEFELPG